MLFNMAEMCNLFDNHKDEESGKVVLGSKYILGGRVGLGAFGSVWYATRLDNKFGLIAVKVEAKSEGKAEYLPHEHNVYKLLGDKVGFPTCHEMQKETKFNWMAIDMVGPSLDFLLLTTKTFDLKTVLMIATQGIERLKNLHDLGLVHRDIKPSNMVIGWNRKLIPELHLIDFGLATRFKVPMTGTHYPLKLNSGLVGTARYASLNAMRGMTQSRRDDMVSFGYTITYLAQGKKNWMNDDATTVEKLLRMKENTTLEQLTEGLPDAFLSYLHYVTNLDFEEEPKYDLMINMFRQAMDQHSMKYDYKYLWDDFFRDKRDSRNKETANGKENKIIIRIEQNSALAKMADHFFSSKSQKQNRVKSNSQIESNNAKKPRLEEPKLPN